MVKCCVVSGCKRESYPGCGISFHKIPNEEDRRELWISSVKLKTPVSKNAHVCGLHFNTEDYLSPNKCYLKPDAVPTVFPMTIPVIKNIILRSDQLQVELSDSEDSMNATDNTHEVPEILLYREGCTSNGDVLEMLDEPPANIVNLMDVAIQTDNTVSTETIKLRAENKALRQKLRRYETKIINLKAILDVVLKKKNMKIIRS